MIFMQPMQSPWQILNLDPDTATEREVKSAYARLIKLHRPDTDPEGFQRVREAYEIGLSLLRQRDQASTSEDHAQAPAAELAADPAPEEAASRSLPPALIEAELACTQAQTADDSAALAKAIGALFFACRSLETGRAAIQLWQESLHRVTGGRSALAALGVTTPQLIAEMEAGSSMIAHACIGHWEQAHDLASMSHLGNELLTHASTLHSPEAAVVALRLAMECGFAFPKLATNLINYAFPHLDREARERFLPQVEQQVRLGMLFTGFRDDQQAFWHQRLRRPQEDWNWNDPASEAAIEYLVSARGETWEGYAILKQAAPAEWFGRLEKAMSRQRGGVFSRWKTMKLGEPQPDKKKRSRVALWVWILAFLAFKFGFLAYEEIRKTSHLPVPAATSAGSSGSWSTLPSKTPAEPSKLPANYALGNQACLKRAMDLRLANPALDRWLDLLRTMQENAWPELAKGGKDEEKKLASFRSEVRQLIASIVRTESEATARQVEELLLMDSRVDHLIKEQVLMQQIDTQTLSHYLPQWELAARASPQLSNLIGAAAHRFLEVQGNRLSSSDEDFQRLKRLEIMHTLR
jgi:hypothetical protein